MAEPAGISFERRFAAWMKSRLGFTSTRLRVPIKGRVSDRHYEVDVHGERFNKNWQVAARTGPALVGAAVVMWIFPSQFAGAQRAAEGLFTSIYSGLAGLSLAIIGVGGYALGHYGKKRSTSHVWVECKDTKTNVKRAQIQKLWSSVEDVLESADASWKPEEVFVVARGFDADALTFAEEYGFSCYRSTESGFECVLKGERIVIEDEDEDEDEV